MTAYAHFASTSPFQSSAHDPSQALAVWNASLNRFSWVGARGIESFQQPAAELAASLHKTTLKQLNAIALTPKALKAAPVVLRFKGAIQVACVAEQMRLAGGDLGVILHSGKIGDRVAQTQGGDASREYVVVMAKQQTTQAQATNSPFSPPQLTAEEWKSFKSIGRMVRKLCREKEGAKPVSRLPDGCINPVTLQAPEPSPVAGLIPIFDVFLVLDANWRVVKSKGSLSRLGWQSRVLRGQAALQLFHPREAALVAKCMQTVETSGKSVKKTASVSNQSKLDRVSCKVLFGAWTVNPAEYFIGLICLEVTKRIVPSVQKQAPGSRLFRLAA